MTQFVIQDNIVRERLDGRQVVVQIGCDLYALRYKERVTPQTLNKALNKYKVVLLKGGE
jgi:hypothetical protein